MERAVDVRVVGRLGGVGAWEGWRAAACGRWTAGPVQREYGLRRGGSAVVVPHLGVGVMKGLWSGLLRGRGGRRGARRVEVVGPLDVAGYDGDCVGVVDGQVGVDEDEEIGHRLGEGERRLEEGPAMGVGVEDDHEERSGWFCCVRSVMELKSYIYIYIYILA